MKYLRELKEWAKHSTREILNQTFTLLGFFIAWLTLTGTARVVVGWLIIWSTLIWVVFMKIRGKEEDNE